MSFGKGTEDFFQNNENPMEIMQFTVRPPPLPSTASLSTTSSNSEINWAQLAQQWIQMRDKNATETSEQNQDNGNSNILGPLAGEKGEADMDMEDDEQPEGMLSMNKKPEVVLQDTFMPHQQPLSVPNIGHLWYMQHYPGGPVPTGGLSWNNEWQKANTSAFSSLCVPPNILKNEAVQMPLPPGIPLEMSINRPDDGKKISTVTSNLGFISETQADESKRKILPAWLREGLEKMEKSKQKQQQQEIAVKGALSKSAFEGLIPDISINNILTKNLKAINSDNENECLGNVKQHISSIHIEKKSSAALLHHKDKGGNDVGYSVDDAEDAVNAATFPNRSCTEFVAIEGKNIEQNPIDLMQAVRRILTELLLEVTNNIISEVAHETHRQMRLKETSVQVVQNKDTLFSITSKLGLAAYDDSSSGTEEDDAVYTSESSNGDRRRKNTDENDESENELLRIIRDKKAEFALFVKNKEIGFLHEENNAEELTINRESVRKKTEPIAQKDVIQRTPMNTLHLPVTNETKGQQIVECSHKNMGETSDTKIQHKNDKHRKGYSSRRKERTTRFSDNKDGMGLPISVISSQIIEKVAMEGVYHKPFSSGGLMEDPLQNDTIANSSKIKSAVASGEENSRNKVIHHKSPMNTKYSSSSLSSASDLETNISASSSSRHCSTRSTSSNRRKGYNHCHGSQNHKDRKRLKVSSERSYRSRSHKKSSRRCYYSSNSDNDQETPTRKKSRHCHRTSFTRHSSSRSRSRSSNVTKKNWY